MHESCKRICHLQHKGRKTYIWKTWPCPFTQYAKMICDWETQRERENSLKLFTLVILGAKIVAMLRAFILLEGSSSATSAMRFKAQSSSAASVEGSCFIRASVSFSPRHLSTAPGLNSSNTPFGSSLNHVCHPHTQKTNPSKFSVQKTSGITKPSQKQGWEAQEMENLKKQDPI